jgi:PAS domain S-box-containing protein
MGQVDDSAQSEPRGAAGDLGEAEWTKWAVESVLAELDTAHEELRTADEELQVQQEEIKRLLSERDSGPWWQGLLTSRLPVGVLITTHEGTIESANEAACMLLGIAQLRLLGKPLQTYVAAEDRPQVRHALSVTSDAGSRQVVTCTLKARTGEDQPVHMVLAPDPELGDGASGAPAAHVCWTLLPLAESSRARQHPQRMAEAFAHLAMLPQRTDQSGFLTAMADICQDVIAPAASVSINIGPPVAPEDLASDAKLAQRMDALQMQANEGPCQEAWERAELVLTNRLDTDARWPRLAELAAAEHVASVLAIPVPVGAAEPLGVINAYATEPDAFSDLDAHTGDLLSSAVAAVIHQIDEQQRLTKLADQLEEALTSRAVIDQAKGILMGRYHCDSDQAFQRLVRVSRNKNIKLRDLARILVDQTQRSTPNATR